MRTAGNNEGRLSRWTVNTGAWILVGLLIFTAALLFSARVEERIFPSVTNVQPSGYAAFAELLKRDGYDVVLDRSVSPTLEQGDVVVSTKFGDYFNDDDPAAFDPFGDEFSGFDEFDEFDFEEYDPWDNLLPHEEALVEHLEAGGTVINVFSRMNFAQAESYAQASATVTSSSDPDRTLKITVPDGLSAFPALPYDQAIYVGWYIDGAMFVTYTSVEEGLLVSIGDGLGLSNRYLDKEQNAEFYLNLFREVAPEGSRIVILEAGIGNAVTPSVTNALGSWAVAARWQMLLLFVVLVFTLAKRFGLPEVDKRGQRGSRELFDAIADVFRRSGNTGLALDNLLIEVDDRIKSVIHASSTLNRSLMLQRVPKDLKERYLNVSELAVSACRPREAVEGAQKLIEQLEQFEADSRSARGLKR